MKKILGGALLLGAGGVGLWYFLKGRSASSSLSPSSSQPVISAGGETEFPSYVTEEPAAYSVEEGYKPPAEAVYVRSTPTITTWVDSATGAEALYDPTVDKVYEDFWHSSAFIADTRAINELYKVAQLNAWRAQYNLPPMSLEADRCRVQGVGTLEQCMQLHPYQGNPPPLSYPGETQTEYYTRIGYQPTV